jgi:hypothetical protein
VTLETSGNSAGVRSVRFTRLDNAVVDVGSRLNQTAPFELTFPPGQQPASLQFTVRRQGAGATMVYLVVVDGCGEWPTFVGGAPGAF